METKENEIGLNLRLQAKGCRLDLSISVDPLEYKQIAEMFIRVEKEISEMKKKIDAENTPATPPKSE